MQYLCTHIYSHLYLDSIVLRDELSQPLTSVLRATLTTPNLFNIKEGSSFSLTCTFEGINDFSLVAYKNGEELFSTSDLRLYSIQMSLSSPVRRSKTLVVNFTKFSDSSNAGSYVCRAENPTQVLDSRNISLLSGLYTLGTPICSISSMFSTYNMCLCLNQETAL